LPSGKDVFETAEARHLIGVELGRLHQLTVRSERRQTRIRSFGVRQLHDRAGNR
jgi:hypothetical protein